MSNHYDPQVHSKNKLGMVGNVPVSPFPVLAAQVKTNSGTVHFRVMGESYITGMIRGAIPPARIKATIKAIEACPAEDSYSGTGSTYRQLTIKDLVSDASGVKVQALMAGDVEVCHVVIDPTWAIVSGDESLQSQIDGGDSGDDSDDSDGGDA